MAKRVLITGGAGFIGIHLANKLHELGFQVTIYDNFSEQIHGQANVRQSKIDLLASIYNVIVGDVLDRVSLTKAIQSCDSIVHLAAETGTGQSMYEIQKYTQVNIEGTSILWDILAKNNHTVAKVVVASSRAIYGEGKYYCDIHKNVYPNSRIEENMLKGDFAVKCPHCDSNVSILPTDENSLLHPNSLYGLTKQVQEQMSILIGRSLNIPTVALRFQNVYGPGQSLSNPYTGILSIFSTIIKNNNKINIFEDGNESRDFVYIEDVVDSIYYSLIMENANYKSLNVGFGQLVSVKEVAESLIQLYGSNVAMEISGNFRVGDIRSNYSDNTDLNNYLEFEPKWKFKDGLANFVKWVNDQEVQKDLYEKSIQELKENGLFK